jgi:hypothetical protein
MAIRKNPSISEILSKFNSAMQKTAEDMEPAPEGAAVCPVCGDPACDGSCAAAAGAAPAEACPACGDPACDGSCAHDAEGVHSDDVAEAAHALEDATANAEAAQAEVAEAKEVLQDLADEFINEHTASLKKEAQVFGQLFAASCLEEMNKTAALQDASANAYSLTSQVCDAQLLQKTAAEAYDIAMAAVRGVPFEDEGLSLEKQASLYTEAYRTVMAKMAGFDEPEEMEEAAGQELSPEEMAAIVAAAQDGEDGTEPVYEGGEPAEEADEPVPEDSVEGALADLSDEELAELAAQISDEVEERTGVDAAEAAEAEAAADQAEALSADEPVDSPESIAAAANMLADSRDEDEEKLASDLSTIADSAYKFAMQAMGR